MEKLEFAPLPSSFMLTAILGFLISVIMVFPSYPQWGFAFAIVFVLMFAASMISMTHAPIGDELHIVKPKPKKKK